jgi:hypothetical protein
MADSKNNEFKIMIALLFLVVLGFACVILPTVFLKVETT